jgi:DNA-binding NtrC family response regulator
MQNHAVTEIRSELLLGRHPDESDGVLRIRDNRVSRKHLRIVLDPREGRPRCADAGSRNGVFLNLERKRGSWLVSPGDVVRIGDTLVLFEQKDEMAECLALVDRAARRDVAVLLLGETGVGKEVLARRLHDQSGRDGPFLAINCAALPRDLVAAELFGHTRGAFSGASEARQGLFVAAQRGTLLLDEIGDIGAEVQAALLRVIEERRVRPLGSVSEVPLDVRLVAATHHELEQNPNFRPDLYARLAQIVIRVPPLRERPAEVLPLARTFLTEVGRARTEIDSDAAEALLTWHWPRNVRELRALIKAFDALEPAQASFDIDAIARVAPDLARAWEAATSDREGDSEEPEREPRVSKAERVRTELEAALINSNGNVNLAAKSLSRPRSYVYRWLETLGLRASDFRRG